MSSATRDEKRSRSNLAKRLGPLGLQIKVWGPAFAGLRSLLASHRKAAEVVSPSRRRTQPREIGRVDVQVPAWYLLTRGTPAWGLNRVRAYALPNLTLVLQRAE